MSFTSLLLFCTSLLLPVEMSAYKAVKVDNKGMYLSRLSYNSVKLAFDQTFIGGSQYHVWHWDQDGKLINMFGGRGEGPGEFMGITDVFWDGSYYWVIDGQRLSSSIFDKEGNYLYRQPQYYRQFVSLENRLFLLDYSRLDPASPIYGQVLREITYTIDDQRLDVQATGFDFKRVSELQMKLRMNFKLVWLVQDDDRILVVDQLEPKMRIYDQAAIDAEDALNAKKPYEPAFIPIQMRNWVEPPESGFERFKTNREFRVWWHSWSRINYFGSLDNDFVVAYEVPDEENPEETVQAIQRIGKDGRILAGPIEVEGFFIGSDENRAYLFYPDESDEEFSYYIRIYSL